MPKFVWDSGDRLKIMDGHQTQKALSSLEDDGYSIPPIPFVLIEAKDEKEAAKKLLALDSRYGVINISTEFFDKYALDIELIRKWIEIPEFGVDLDELTKRFNSEIEGNTDPDEVPEVDEKEVYVKKGDLYQLGNHRVLCGDSTRREEVDILMNGEKAVLGFTSPPYWVGKDYEKETSVQQINEFIEKSCVSFDRAILKDSSRIVINTSTGFTTSFDKKKKRQVLLLIDKWTNNFYKIGWNLRHLRHWIKDGQLMGTSLKTDMIDQHCEFLVTYENDDGLPMQFEDTVCENDVNVIGVYYNPSGTSRGQERTGKKWALRSYWNDIRGTANSEGHCAAFPVELPKRHVLLYTKKGESVFDPFSGSGSTLIACEKTNRRCFALEISPLYCQVIIERWEKFTNKKAVKL